MDIRSEAHLITKLIEYGLANESFTLIKLKKDLGLKDEDGTFGYVYNLLTAFDGAVSSPNHIIGASSRVFYEGSHNVDHMSTTYRLLPSAYFSYIDLQEVQLAREMATDARKNAKDARLYSLIALGISLVALILSGYQTYLQYRSVKPMPPMTIDIPM
jgi:hypothetical protein